jgi:DNA-binding transcriptional LysR family regulator
MEMHQIRYFLAVCEVRNFTRAAERCKVSQPALTRGIQQLEEELGGPLLIRGRGASPPTELGRIMQPYLERVMQHAAEARRRAEAFVGLEDVALTVGVMCTIGPHRLLDLFASFRAHHRGVELHLRDATALELDRLLAGGELDLAIYGLPDGIDQQFHSLELFRERFVIAMGRGHPLARRRAVRLADMDRQSFIGRLNCEFWDFFASEYARRAVKPVLTYMSEREDWIQAMAKAGLGAACLPEFAVTVAGLAVRPLIEPKVSRIVHLNTVRGRPHAPAVGAFVEEAVRWRRRHGGGRAAAEAQSGGGRAASLL